MHFNVFSFFAANHVAITSTNSYYFHVFWMNNRTLEEIAIYLITTNDQELWISRMKCAWLEFVSIWMKFMYAFSTWHSWPNSCTVFANRGNILPTSIPANWKDIFDVSLKDNKFRHVNYIEINQRKNLYALGLNLQVELEAVSLYIN